MMMKARLKLSIRRAAQAGKKIFFPATSAGRRPAGRQAGGAGLAVAVPRGVGLNFLA
jgi:hypothetical protein